MRLLIFVLFLSCSLFENYTVNNYRKKEKRIVSTKIVNSSNKQSIIDEMNFQVKSDIEKIDTCVGARTIDKKIFLDLNLNSQGVVSKLHVEGILKPQKISCIKELVSKYTFSSLDISENLHIHQELLFKSNWN